MCGFVAAYYFAVAVDKEFRKVPLDARLLGIVRVGFAKHLVEQRSEFIFHVKALESLLCFQVGKKEATRFPR